VASIQKRPDGQWRARYRDEQYREHSRHFARKVDAQRWLDAVTASLVTGTYVDPKLGKITYLSYYLVWSSRQVWVHHTRRAMDKQAQDVPFGDVALANIRSSHIESWVKAMSSTLAPLTIKQRVQNARTVLKAAMKDKVLGADPSLDVKLPRVRRAEAAMSIPTPSDIGSLLLAAPQGFEAYIAVCAFAGLRRGEAAALQPGDVDFLKRTISVNRQAQGIRSGVVEIQPPKYGSERCIPVPDGLLQILAEHIRLHVRGDDAGAWMFPGLRGNPMEGNMVGTRWRRARRETGVAYRLHDLRHYFASGLIAAGCDVVTVQRALGHSSAAITLGTYSHLWPDSDDRTRKAANAMFAEVIGTPADSLRTESGI